MDLAAEMTKSKKTAKIAPKDLPALTPADALPDAPPVAPVAPAAALPAKRAAKKTARLSQADAGAPKSAAESACERMILYIRHFEGQLDQSQEVAMGFTGSEAGVLRIEGLGFSAPDILTFYGQDEDGIRTQMIQHVSQLSVLLRAVPKLAPEEPPLRIGFRLMQGWGGGESGDGSA